MATKNVPRYARPRDEGAKLPKDLLSAIVALAELSLTVRPSGLASAL